MDKNSKQWFKTKRCQTSEKEIKTVTTARKTSKKYEQAKVQSNRMKFEQNFSKTF